MRLSLWICAIFALSFSLMEARTLSVGPGRTYSKPCQAIADAVSGDTIEIDAGVYSGDACALQQDNLTLRGVGGRPRIEAAGAYAWGKGIWVVAGNNTLIENIEFTGAAVPDGNGAGIRLDSGNLTVRNCYFHHNENGILGGSYGSLLVESTEFADNGVGDGYTHNIYVNSGITTFTLQYSYSHNVRIGHLVKSRAQTNYILYNRLTEEGGTGSYELDLPNGGLAYVIGNSFQQDDATDNASLISYGMEGLSAGAPVHQLHVVNNTFVNMRAAGGTFVQVGGGLPSVLRNNIFAGPGLISNQPGAQQQGNVTGGMDVGFLNAAAYDYRLTALSAALNAGVEPGSGWGGYSLRPVKEYRHRLCRAPRADVGNIDAGAFEYGNVATAPGCGSAPAAEPFADVSPSDPFLPAIELMRDKHITDGCGVNPARYCPEDNVTRGQMAVFLVRSVLGGDNFTAAATPYFNDVPASHPFFRWIQKLKELGITNGCAAAAYCPGDTVSRGQMAAFIIRARFGPTTPFASPAAPLFSDVAGNYPFFAPVQKMKQIGITSGCSATGYCPDSPVTRGQMAVFVMRGLFNQFLPDSTPVLTSASPGVLLAGQSVTVTVTGRGTAFQSGVTTVTANPGISVTELVVLNSTTLQVRLGAFVAAGSGPISLTAKTGEAEATLPNGIQVQ